ncbi:LamG domain-containing protein [Ferruginibacter sp.]|nr:LamG domain-containing protein [Ferruginibacter sp.]
MKKILFALLLTTEFVFGQVDINSGLRAYYPFNGNANDASGNNNNPSFNNATLTADRLGKANSAYHFNGINNYIRIPNSRSLNLGNTITLSVWVRPTGFYYDICHASSILSKGTADYYPGNYTLRFDDALYTEGKGCSGDRLSDSLHLNFRATGTPQIAYRPYINKNQWYQVIYTNDGDTAKLYVDCALKYAVNFKEIFSNGDDLFLGKTNDPLFPFWLNADIDEIRIYDRALKENEILALCKEEIKKDSVVKKDSIKPVTLIDNKPLEKRNNELVKQIIVDNDSISVTLYDNGDIDGDSVTLIYNNRVITTHQRLSDKPKTFILKVEPGNNNNELVMYAENLGSIPPNTALMVIYDGKKRYELNISSTNNSNGVVAFRLKE